MLHFKWLFVLLLSICALSVRAQTFYNLSTGLNNPVFSQNRYTTNRLQNSPGLQFNLAIRQQLKKDYYQLGVQLSYFQLFRSIRSLSFNVNPRYQNRELLPKVDINWRQSLISLTPFLRVQSTERFDRLKFYGEIGTGLGIFTIPHSNYAFHFDEQAGNLPAEIQVEEAKHAWTTRLTNTVQTSFGIDYRIFDYTYIGISALYSGSHDFYLPHGEAFPYQSHVQVNDHYSYVDPSIDAKFLSLLFSISYSY